MIRIAFLAFFGFLFGSAWAQSALYSNGPSAVPLAQLDKSSPNNLTTGPRANSSGPCVGCGGGGAPFNPSCSQSSTLIAALDGTENKSAVDTMICGFVTDSTYSLFWGLWMFATSSTTNALIDWANPGFHNATSHGTLTFTANVGYTGDGSTGYLDTNLLANAPGQNSVSLGECDLTANSSTSNQAQMGLTEATSTYIILNGGSGGSVNLKSNSTGSAGVPTISSTQGSYVLNRTASTGYSFQLNAGTAQNFTDTSGTTSAFDYFIFARNSGGASNIAENFTSDQLAYAFIATGLTAGQVTSIYNRLNTYLNTVGSAGPC